MPQIVTDALRRVSSALVHELTHMYQYRTRDNGEDREAVTNPDNKTVALAKRKHNYIEGTNVKTWLPSSDSRFNYNLNGLMYIFQPTELEARWNEARSAYEQESSKHGKTRLTLYQQFTKVLLRSCGLWSESKTFGQNFKDSLFTQSNEWRTAISFFYAWTTVVYVPIFLTSFDPNCDKFYKFVSELVLKKHSQYEYAEQMELIRDMYDMLNVDPYVTDYYNMPNHQKKGEYDTNLVRSLRDYKTAEGEGAAFKIQKEIC